MRSFKNWNRLLTSVPFLISEDPPIFICLSHKSGSTIFKHVFMNNNTRGFDRSIRPHGMKTFEYNQKYHILHKVQDPQAKFYVVSRHPVNRLLSGFMEKIMSNECEKFKPRGYKCNSQSLDLFVRTLIRDENAHNVFKRQTDGCFFDQLRDKYTVLKLESFDEWINEFINVGRLKIDEAFWRSSHPKRFTDLNHYTGSDYMTTRMINSDLRNSICRWASKDLVFLNYTCFD